MAIKHLRVDEIVHSISKTHNFGQNKLFAINTSDVEKGRFLNPPLLNIDELKGQFKKTIKTNDILFSEIRPANKHYALVKIKDTTAYVASTKLMVLRKINNSVDLLYFYYWLTSNNMLRILQSRAENRICSFPQITFDLLGEYRVPIPEPKVQQKIATILKSIDLKIENNTKIAAELEAMAKTIYDYWFLQFDFPDENGKPYKFSGGKMVWNDELKREIPDGWNCKTLDFISKIETSSVTPQKGCVYHHYSIPAFDEKHIPVTEYGDEIDSGKYKVPSNSILVSKLNPQFKRIWLVGNVSDNCICSTEFMPFVSLNNTTEFLYETINSDAFYTYMVNSSSSSTGSRKRMQPELCGIFKIAYPEDDSIIRKFGSTVNAMLLKTAAIYKENQELASLLDFLLPMLMNGQVEV